MSTTTTTTGRSAPGPTPSELGVGMRVSIHPHCDGFVDVILGAVAEVADAGLTEGLTTVTDDVSTYVGATQAPAEQRLVRYLAALLTAAARRTSPSAGDGSDGGAGHVVAHVLLSRGCPGEVSCDLQATGLPSPEPVDVPATGIAAAAQWSLYPLIDAGSPHGEHMQHIEVAIARARDRGAAAAPAHYATRLSGDLADVLATAVDAWAGVGSEVPHVVTHLTVSVGSPSRSAAGDADDDGAAW